MQATRGYIGVYLVFSSSFSFLFFFSAAFMVLSFDLSVCQSRLLVGFHAAGSHPASAARSTAAPQLSIISMAAASKEDGFQRPKLLYGVAASCCPKQSVRPSRAGRSPLSFVPPAVSAFVQSHHPWPLAVLRLFCPIQAVAVDTRLILQPGPSAGAASSLQLRPSSGLSQRLPRRCDGLRALLGFGQLHRLSTGHGRFLT